MESIQSVAERIVDLSPGALDKATCIYAVNKNITWLIDHIFKMVKNINETSLPGSDRGKRLLEIEEKYGIPINHLL